VVVGRECTSTIPKEVCRSCLPLIIYASWVTETTTSSARPRSVSFWLFDQEKEVSRSQATTTISGIFIIFQTRITN
jgi:hypothetical protein